MYAEMQYKPEGQKQFLCVKELFFEEMIIGPHKIKAYRNQSVTLTLEQHGCLACVVDSISGVT